MGAGNRDMVIGRTKSKEPRMHMLARAKETERSVTEGEKYGIFLGDPNKETYSTHK